ncbi:MAG: protein kinase [Nannocystaceae bacterium]|nr:protein kinase [Nannocystaceae bacterium]
MSQIPVELARAISSGDCVLWVGAGFGSLAGRPNWEQLLRRLVPTCEASARDALGDLIEQGRWRTVLTYVHRHFGDEPLAKLLKEISTEGEGASLAEGATKLAELPWRACFATAYPDLVSRIFSSSGGHKPAVLSHVDVHHLSLREHEKFFILRTPPTGRAMRADGVFFDLVEEVARTRTILFLGFDPDDPDLVQIFDLLDRIGRGNTHYALLPWVTPPEAEELRDRFAIEVVPGAADRSLPALFDELARACAEVAARPSAAGDRLVALDLARVTRGIELRADLARDEALTLDVAWIENLIDALPPGGGGVAELPPATLLRTGCVLLAHGRIERARKCFQQVITHGAGREYSNIARFDLAWAAAIEGDRAAALDGLVGCAEADRSLALVPPRFELREVLGMTGTGMLLLCRDRETKTDLEVAVATLARPVGEQEHTRFHAAVQKLAALDHPAVKGVRGGFADGRLFGIMREPTPGLLLGESLDDEPMSLAKALEIVQPLVQGLAACHAAGVLHRNLNPHNVLVAGHGAVLRGFGFPPVIGWARPSVRASNLGYTAPELLREGVATAASDVYSLAALCYRLLTGRAPLGAVPPAHDRNRELDPRVDPLLRRALHPLPSERPSLGELGEGLAQILATPELGAAMRAEAEAGPGRERVVDLSRAGTPKPVVDRGSGDGAVPQPVEEAVSAPLGQKFLAPEDPDDLEAWAWILERKPTHTEARAAVARIEAAAREAARWDRVAEALKVRLSIAQVVRDRIAIIRELAEIYELRLAAPANAFEIVQGLIEVLPASEQPAAIADLRRLAELTGQWSQLADSMMIVAERTSDTSAQAALFGELGAVFLDKLGATDRAVAAYEKANELVPSAQTLSAVVPLYRKLGRDAELVGALLSLADLQKAGDRHASLVAAAKALRESLGDEEGAFGAIEIVLAEDPDHADALAAGESLARALDRRAALIDILARRAHAALADGDAVAKLREAASLAAEAGEGERRLELLGKLLQRKPDDRSAAEQLVLALREAVARDAGKRTLLVDALATWIDLVEAPTERAALLAEQAGLLDLEVDGKERAADCRERLLELVGAEHALAREAAAALVKWYRRQDDRAALAKLWQRQAQAVDADEGFRAEAWQRLLELRKSEDAADGAVVEALEQLVKLQPSETKWRDELLERYLAADDFKRAGPLIRAQVDAETDPKRKAELLLRGGILRQEIGKVEGAVEALEQAVALDPSLTDAWLQLRELYASNDQPLKAIEAQVAAARSHGNRVEKVKLLFDAGKTYVDELGKPDRGLALLEEVVELDPDHRDATGILLERLVAHGDLSRAWPQAQIYVMQVRSQQPGDHALNLRALSLAGRCALAVDAKDRAREYLEKARALDATNLDVLRLLAELDMDAGKFADALRHYQSVVLGVGDKLAPGELSRLYVRMADARLGMDEKPKAVQMLERALDIDPDNEAAVDRMIELSAGAGGAAAVVKAKRKLVDLLARREKAVDDPAATKELQQRRIAVLQEIAKTQVDDLKLLEEGVRTLEEVLAIVPDDPAVLHKILDLFTAAQRWRDATNVLARLSDAQKNDVIRAKYLYAGAVIIRDHLDDLTAARDWLSRTMECDPSHEKAYVAFVELLEKTKDYKELGRAIRARLKSLPEGTPPAKHLELFTRLGEVYERLDQAKTALMAFHQAARLAQAAGESDEQVRKRHEKAMRMAIALGDDELDKAVAHGHALISATPMEFETYHRLVEIYLKMNRRDRARAIARTLRFLKQADEAEIELAESGTVGAQARGTISRELWRQALQHPNVESRLSDVFAIVWPMVAAREGRTLAHHRVRRDARTDVSLQSPTAIARYLAHACQVLDAPVPDLYVQPDEQGGFKVDALADVDGGPNRTVYPSIFAGKDALSEQTEIGNKFRAGRIIARAKPEHILSAVLSSATSLRHAAWGAIAVTQPEIAVPLDCKSQAAAYGDAFVKFLQASRLETLKALTAKLAKSGDVDARAWLAGVAYTVTRAGFALSDSIDVAAQILTREGDEGSPIPAKERIRDLVAYSVSEPYLRLRKELNFAR